MTLPSSGPISASMINVELGRASNAPFDINGAAERALAQKPSGTISFSDFYGKSSFSKALGGMVYGGMANNSYTAALPASRAGIDYILILCATGTTTTPTPSGFPNLYVIAPSGQYSGISAWGKVSGGETQVTFSTGSVGISSKYYIVVVENCTTNPVITPGAGTGGAAALPSSPGSKSVCAAIVGSLNPAQIAAYPAGLPDYNNGLAGASFTTGMWGASGVKDANSTLGSFTISGKSEWRNLLAAFT